MPRGETTLRNDKRGLTKGMPYLGLRENKEALTLLETVRGNFEGYTKHQLVKAIEARKLHAKLAYPADEKLMQMVSRSGFKNCNTTAGTLKFQTPFLVPIVQQCVVKLCGKHQKW